MPLGQTHQGRHQTAMAGGDERPGATERQHKRRVRHVLTGGAEVNVPRARGIGAGDPLGQLLDERHHWRRRTARGGADCAGIVRGGWPGGLGDGRGRSRRNHPALGQRRGKTDLELQHAIDHGVVGKHCRHGAGRRERVDQPVRH